MAKKDQPLNYTSRNWRAYLKNPSKENVLETRIYTDARILGELHDLGPYSFLNTISHGSTSRDKGVLPAIVLRVAVQDEADSRVPHPTENNFDHYHGGDFVDEMAALVSLGLGIRAKAGRVDREFRGSQDRFGRPIEYGSKPIPQLLIGGETQIPGALGERNLTELSLLKEFPNRGPKESNAFIKAARLYQQAIWIADADPELSWILFVSAIEAAALVWADKAESAVERVRFSHPDLIELLEKEAPTIAEKVAKMLVSLVGSTKRFVDFVVQFCPKPPTQRPAPAFQFRFDEEAVRSASKIIYRHRSKSLHAGTAFPRPMCMRPAFMKFKDVTDEGYQEIPFGLGMYSQGASWKIEQTPMLLHTFEYITRGSLISWWKSSQESAP